MSEYQNRLEREAGLEDALKGVMRNQARLLEAWAEGERYDEDSEVVSELAASRDAAKAVLGPSSNVFREAKWPTDESVRAMTKEANVEGSWYSHKGRRAALRAGMMADPIMQAAIAWKQHVDVVGTRRQALPGVRRDLWDALDEAGF